jgi:hypothetical protein
VRSTSTRGRDRLKHSRMSERRSLTPLLPTSLFLLGHRLADGIIDIFLGERTPEGQRLKFFQAVEDAATLHRDDLRFPSPNRGYAQLLGIRQVKSQAVTGLDTKPLPDAVRDRNRPLRGPFGVRVALAS